MLSLGKALMTSPKLLLLDEPTLGLAPVVVAGIFQAMDNLRKMGVTIVVAEQNASFTLSFSDKIYLLERGRLVVGGTPEELKGDDYVRKTYFGL
jgi:branched-chain amino acid transport system ATP-binding protein